jgi:hypothetical protein
MQKMKNVIPAKAGIHRLIDPGFRRGDNLWALLIVLFELLDDRVKIIEGIEF